MASEADVKTELERLFPGCVSFDEPMSRHTSFKVGGPATIFARPDTVEDAVSMICWARDHGLPVTVVGDGTNLIVRDGGIDGLVLSLSSIRGESSWDEQDDGTVILTAHAGLKTRDLCKQAWEKGYAGLNFALGIPGTLGGNIAMNAGTQLGSMGDVLVYMDVMSALGSIIRIERKDMTFSYRSCEWPDYIANPVIIRACLKLSKEEPQVIENQARALLKKRTKTQPVALPNAGCIFKNPSQGHPAGKLIDMAGLKGFSIGEARISEKHANFIVNTGNAKASDILSLVDKIRETVSDHFDVTLETEVHIVGKEN